MRGPLSLAVFGNAATAGAARDFVSLSRRVFATHFEAYRLLRLFILSLPFMATQLEAYRLRLVELYSNPEILHRI
jgi:hypothetical protein